MVYESHHKSVVDIGRYGFHSICKEAFWNQAFSCLLLVSLSFMKSILWLNTLQSRGLWYSWLVMCLEKDRRSMKIAPPICCFLSHTHTHTHALVVLCFTWNNIVCVCSRVSLTQLHVWVSLFPMVQQQALFSYTILPKHHCVDSFAYTSK